MKSKSTTSTDAAKGPEDMPAGTRRRRPTQLRTAAGSATIAVEFRGQLNPQDSPAQRPLIGKDIDEWCAANRLERLQAVQMLAMAAPYAYKRITSGQGRLEPLPFGLEILLRRYMRTSIQFERRRPIDIFQKIYGDKLKEFEGGPYYEAARVMLYARFGALLGRTVFSVYRWLKEHNTSGSGVSGPLRRLFEQLPEDPKLMREELEDLARITFKVRGYDFDSMFPVPDINNPPPGRRVRRLRRKRDTLFAVDPVDQGGSADGADVVTAILAHDPEPAKPKRVARKRGSQ